MAEGTSKNAPALIKLILLLENCALFFSNNATITCLLVNVSSKRKRLATVVIVSPYTIGPYLAVLAQPSYALKAFSSAASSSSTTSSKASFFSGFKPSGFLVINADDDVGSTVAAFTAETGFAGADSVTLIAGTSKKTGIFL